MPALGAGGREFDPLHSDQSYGGISSVGRVAPLQGEGRRFDPVIPHQLITVSYKGITLVSKTNDGGSIPSTVAIEQI